ncbi:MAG: neutral/alkaline non-lysosomal ceramidase N-terminal domain-containing protein [Bacteroidia bacterium]|nr:neutral/alkaline non-lysosomal ceramidase N-terminal domain-containing protein [Bacteroidia bacterium]
MSKCLCKIFVAFVALVGILCGCNGSSGSLYYNYKVADITPEGSVALAGYSMRKGLSTGVHTPLKTRCLVIASASEKVCIISNDLHEISPLTADSLRAEISKQSGMPAGNIFIHCTHTHSASAVEGRWTKEGNPNYEYAVEVKNTIVNNAVEAIADVDSYAPFTMELAMGEGSINYNRKDKNAHTDRDVYVLRLLDKEGKPVLSLVNYACHPVCLHSGSKVVSTDFPGFTVRELEKHWGGNVMYFSGASGNSNPTDSLSRHYAYAEYKGKKLAEDIKDIAFEKVKTSGELKVCNKEARLPFLADTITVELIENHIKEVIASGLFTYGTQTSEVESWSVPVLEAVKSGKVKNYLPLKVSAVNIGGVVFVFSQGEPYMEYQTKLRSEFPATPIFFAAYTNGQNTYLPSKVAYTSEIYDYDTKLIHVDIGTPYPLSDKMPDCYSAALKEVAAEVINDGM